MEIKVLKDLGLTDGEIKVFTSLIKIGSTSAGALIKNSEMQRSAVYFCLDSLIKKGLVGYILKNNRKYFEANKPESLFEFVKEKKRELEKQEVELNKCVPFLFEKKKFLKNEQEAKIYEGWKGILNAFFEALDSIRTGGKAYAFSPTEDYGGANPEQVRNLITKVRLRRVMRKINLKMIMCENLKNSLGKDQEGTAYTQVRYLPKKEVNPAVVNIYGDITIIVLWAKSPLAFMIKSRDVSVSFKNYFEILWETAK
jgi:predicted transcriptional regulator